VAAQAPRQALRDDQITEVAMARVWTPMSPCGQGRPGAIIWVQSRQHQVAVWARLDAIFGGLEVADSSGVTTMVTSLAKVAARRTPCGYWR